MYTCVGERHVKGSVGARKGRSFEAAVIGGSEPHNVGAGMKMNAV